MAGTKEGGAKAAQTNREKYGADFYIVQGKAGGSAPYKGKKGFAANIELARASGKKGGKLSKRGKKVTA